MRVVAGLGETGKGRWPGRRERKSRVGRESKRVCGGEKREEKKIVCYTRGEREREVCRREEERRKEKKKG